MSRGHPVPPRFWLQWDVQIPFARRGFAERTPLFAVLEGWDSAPLRFMAMAARMRFFKAASSILSPSWMSVARLTFPSTLELNRPAGSGSAAPLANVILTAFLYVSPGQTMPPWDQTGKEGSFADDDYRM